MPVYTVLMTRHMISYRTATAHDVVAADATEAARLAEQADLVWWEDDGIDEGPVDYEVSGPDVVTISWREDGECEIERLHGPSREPTAG